MRTGMRSDAMLLLARAPLLALLLLASLAVAFSSPLGSAQHPFLGDAAPHGDEPTLGAEASTGPGWVYLIRHGEKVKADRPGLSADGRRRAKCLRKVFGKGALKADYAMAQAYKSHGRRRRAYETLKPLAKRTGIPLDTSCQRDDPVCVRRVLLRETAAGRNVVLSWEHAALTPIARQLGVHGLAWDGSRFDIIYHIRGGKVHRIDSEECAGLDEEWFGWHAKKSRSGRGRGGSHGLLVDDESWADGAGERLADHAREPSQEDADAGDDDDDEAGAALFELLADDDDDLEE